MPRRRDADDPVDGDAVADVGGRRSGGRRREDAGTRAADAAADGRADEGPVAAGAVAGGAPRSVPDSGAVTPDTTPARRRLFGRRRPDRTPEPPAPKRRRTVADLVAERAAEERAAREVDAR